MNVNPKLISLKIKVAQIACHPIVGYFISALFRHRIPSDGFLFFTNNEQISHRTVASIFWGLYESAEIRYIKGKLLRDLDVIELGCSIGITSSHIARQLDKNCKMILIEANALLIDTLKLNLTANFPDKNFIIVNKAIDYTGKKIVNLEMNGSNTGSRISNHSGLEKVGRVGTTTLSQMISENSIEECVLVCDIEGSEAGIIFEDKTGMKCVKQLLIELHETNYKGEVLTVDSLCKLIESKHGFEMRASYGPVFLFEKSSAL